MIDVHAHYLPPSLLDRAGADSGLVVGYDAEERRLSFPAGPSRPVPAPLTDLVTRSGWNAQRSIHLQVLSPWLDVAGDDLEGDDAVRWTAAMNDATAADIEGNVGFGAFAALPVVDGGAAAAELRRTVTELGFLGGSIPTQVGGRNLDDAGLDPLFAAATELRVPLFIHPHRVLGAERLSKDFLTNVCGNPFETTVAALSLFFDGTFDRYPDLKILLAHCGGTLPMLAGRAVRAVAAGAASRRGAENADEILNCFTYDTVVHDPGVLAFGIARLGHDRLVLGTDYPFPMLVDDPIDLVRQALVATGEDAHGFDHITRVGPAKLLGLG
ncbi:MAG: amidohydrolase family protein [Acidimicrobiales bacterium]|nr:amidohydrolase family protein [Acidimicrobiales bacterium]